MNESQKKLLQEALRRSQLIKKLIDQLLRIVHFESGQLKMDIAPCNLTTLIQDMVKYSNTELMKKNIVLIYKPENNLLFALTDQNCVKIILEVIFGNAIQYTSERGTISITTESLVPKGQQKILITIQDTGIGIPENQHMNVFTQFFRAQNAFSLFPNGTGIGLFYTKKLIEALGGSIWFRSAEGKGTTFYLTLPLAPVLKTNG